MDGNPGREHDRADQGLDLFIQRRHEEREGRGEANAAEQAENWRMETYLRDEEEEKRRRAWLDWHTRQAELLEALAGEHRAERRKLLDAALSKRG